MTKAKIPQVAADNARWVQKFLDHQERVAKRQRTTLACYSADLARFLEHLGAKSVLAANAEDMAQWVGRERHTPTGEAAPATIKREIVTLSSFYGYLVNHAEVLTRNPAAKLPRPKIHNEDPHPVPTPLWRDIWFGQLEDDERVALGLGYFCGLRRQEIVRLSPFQFTSARSIADARRKGGKTQTIRWGSAVALYAQKMPHLIGDPSMFVQPLERLLAARKGEPTVLPWDPEVVRVRYASRTHFQRPVGVVDPMTFNRKLNQLTDRLGVARTTPHALRHSFCTNMIDAGVPVQVVSRLAGHSSIEVTMRYIRTADDPLADLLVADGTAEAPRLSKWT